VGQEYETAREIEKNQEWFGEAHKIAARTNW